MLIEIVSVNLEDKGKYKQLNVAYRNNGKLSEKKLMSFGAGVDAFETLQKANNGDSYDVVAVKNDKGFWDWTSATISDGTVKAAAPNTPAPGRTFETPEERATRQKYIIRQSSLSNALEFLKLNKGEDNVTLAQVQELANTFVNYVYNKDFTGLEDDLPF